MPLDNPMERGRTMAKLYWSLTGEHDHRIKEVAKTFKCRADTVKKLLNLLRLAPEVQRAVALRALGLEEAQEYAALPHADQLEKFVTKTLDDLERGQRGK